MNQLEDKAVLVTSAMGLSATVGCKAFPKLS